MSEIVGNIIAALLAGVIIGGIALGVLWMRNFELTPMLITITFGAAFFISLIAIRQSDG